MRTFLFIPCFFAINAVHAQTYAGAYNVGMDVDAAYMKYDDRNLGTNNLDLGLTGMFFISAHTALGLRFFESFNNFPDNIDPFSLSRQNKMYSFGLIAKNYRAVNQRFGYVLGTAISYGTGENSRPISGFNSPQFSGTFTLSGSPGLYCFLTKHVAIETSFRVLSVQYVEQWNSGNVGAKEKNIEFSGWKVQLRAPDFFNINSLNLSVIYYFSKT